MTTDADRLLAANTKAISVRNPPPNQRTGELDDMNARRNDTPDARPLDILGVSEVEERAYEFLLEHPQTTTRDISQAMHLSLYKTQRLLNAIENKGLVVRSTERVPRYIPGSPDIAMEGLILQRQRDLQNARARVQELQRLMTSHRGDPQEQMLELITSPEAERQAWEQMQSSAQHEMLALVRFPMRISNRQGADVRNQQLERELRARGIHYRTIVDAEWIAAPGKVDRVRSDIESNEEVRVFPHLPFKMIIADRRTALVPLDLQEPDSPAVLVRSSALLDALYALFEILWERSAPLSFDRKGLMKTGVASERVSQEVGDVLALLTAGMNDKAIAAELKISTRTLERRILELMQNLDARTRFQAGWLAAQRSSNAGSRGHE